MLRRLHGQGPVKLRLRSGQGIHKKEAIASLCSLYFNKDESSIGAVWKIKEIKNENKNKNKNILNLNILSIPNDFI